MKFPRSRLRGRPAILPVEPLDSARGIDQLLFAREKRVALRADVEAQIGPGAARRELCPTGATEDGFFVFRVNLRPHRRGPPGNTDP